MSDCEDGNNGAEEMSGGWSDEGVERRREDVAEVGYDVDDERKF